MADTKRAQCRCARCRIRGLMGPVMLIAIGGIFMAGEYTPYGFVQLWPILLVVPGLILLAKSAASNKGHIDS